MPLFPPNGYLAWSAHYDESLSGSLFFSDRPEQGLRIAIVIGVPSRIISVFESNLQETYSPGWQLLSRRFSRAGAGIYGMDMYIAVFSQPMQNEPETFEITLPPGDGDLLYSIGMIGYEVEVLPGREIGLIAEEWGDRLGSAGYYFEASPDVQLAETLLPPGYEAFMPAVVVARRTDPSAAAHTFPELEPYADFSPNALNWRRTSRARWFRGMSGDPWAYFVGLKYRDMQPQSGGGYPPGVWAKGMNVNFAYNTDPPQAELIRVFAASFLFGEVQSSPPFLLTSWNVQDDLPTEDVGRPQFTRRSMAVSLPLSYEPQTEIELHNPVIPTTLYRGLPRNSSRSGGLVQLDLEPIEARWQRAVSKQPFIRLGTFTGQQALQDLLTQRQTEFDFLQWEPIPVLYWPDGMIPTLKNPSITIGENISVFDEVLELLAAFPGYTLDWTPENRLRVVVPPFAPNAPASLILNARDGVFERTGYTKTELVRSVRVKSQPFEFTPGLESVVNPVAVRVADNEFSTNPIANKPDVRTRGDIQAGSTTLRVRNTLSFAPGDWLYIAGAGAGGQPLAAQILSITGNDITLSATASTTVSEALVRYLYHYPPPPDNSGVETTVITYGAGYVEVTYLQPFRPNTIVDEATVRGTVLVDTWRLPALPPPLPYQTTDQAVDVVIGAGWTQIYASPVRDRLALASDTWGGFVRVEARRTAGGIEWRIKADTFADGGAFVAPGNFTIRRWFAGYRIYLDVRASVWKKGSATYSAEYKNPSGYLDLPEIDVSATGITESETLQRLARLIAEYRSRQAIQWQLSLSQPWALRPTDKGRRIELPGGIEVIPDAYRLGVAYGLEEVSAPMVVSAWQYNSLTYLLANEDGDLLANNAGDVLGR